MNDPKDPAKLLEALLASQTEGGAAPLTAEEVQQKIDEQEKEIAENFKKLETKDIVKMLVAAENYLNFIHRSNPALTKRNHASLENARVLISCVLDGRKPQNLDELGPTKF